MKDTAQAAEGYAGLGRKHMLNILRFINENEGTLHAPLAQELGVKAERLDDIMKILEEFGYWKKGYGKEGNVLVRKYYLTELGQQAINSQLQTNLIAKID